MYLVNSCSTLEKSLKIWHYIYSCCFLGTIPQSCNWVYYPHKFFLCLYRRSTKSKENIYWLIIFLLTKLLFEHKHDDGLYRQWPLRKFLSLLSLKMGHTTYITVRFPPVQLQCIFYNNSQGFQATKSNLLSASELQAISPHCLLKGAVPLGHRWQVVAKC